MNRSNKAGIILNIDRQTIRRWINDGKINAIKTVGGHNRIPASEIDRLLSNSSGGNFSESASEFNLSGKDRFEGWVGNKIYAFALYSTKLPMDKVYYKKYNKFW